MIICFTGSRDYGEDYDTKRMPRNLELAKAERRVFDRVASCLDLQWRFYVGDCPSGLDNLVRERFPSARVFVARWNELGPSAGPKRNTEMLHAAQYDSSFMGARDEFTTLVAFPGGRGTNGCVAIAKRLKIPVLRVE